MTATDDFLINHAYSNVWCSPGQDRQHIVAPARMTKSWGVQGTVRIGKRQVELPTRSEWYHVFVIGDLPPILVGMETIYNQWISVKSHCVRTSLLVDLYFNNGVHFPTHRAYFLYTTYGNLIIAFKSTPRVGDPGTDQPYIRWRSNAYFDGSNTVPLNGGIEIDGITFTDNTQFYNFQARFRATQLKAGKTFAFVNGRRVKDINLTVAVIGDVLEYYRDESVKEVIELPVSQLSSFDSILDNKGKFLLPRDGLGSVIDYRDDVDVYILNYVKSAEYRGVYYHQNRIDALRMVTHRDYSIVSSYLLAYLNDHDWTFQNNLRIELIVRTAGWRRELVDEHHRIKELYRLTQSDRIDAMIGEQAGVDVWKVANLENSQYPQLMRADNGGITRSMVESAYGYNAVSKILADSPIKVPDGRSWVTLPYGLREKATIFEYNNEGRLLGWYIHQNSHEYPLRNTDCRYIEGYFGISGLGLNTQHNAVGYVLEEGVDYRFYVADIIEDETPIWRDVTGDTDYYQVTQGNEVQWNVDFSNYHTAIRHDQNILCYNVELDYRDRVLAFTIQMKEAHEGGEVLTGPMLIPPGELDVFINGWLLIENIDYYVNWPEICVVNKTRLSGGPIQMLTIRARGFCSSEMERDLPADVGFVAYGLLSRNAHFHVRDDKVCRISIGGALYTRDEVKVSEDDTIEMTGVENGTPYQIVHPIVPTARYVDVDTYTYRAASQEADTAVEGYLTMYLPEPVQENPNPIPAWYKVYSPFTCKLIYDMIYGLLPMDEFKGEYSLELVSQRLAGYEWTLAYDPALKNADERYIIIHPHPEDDPIQLDIYQYRLLRKAIEVFLDNKVAINRQVLLVEEGFEYEEPDHPHPYRLRSEVPGVTSF